MSDTAYHYTKVINLAGIFDKWTLLPSPPLAAYGLCRDAVEADPARYGFQVRKLSGRRIFSNQEIHDSICPKVLYGAAWHEGERFAVAFSRAGWCGSALGYLPPGKAEAGWAFRLAIDLRGLDVFTWQQYQSRTNVPGASRRVLGELSREKGDDTADWLFVLGPVFLPGRLFGLEQYHQGRWISFEEVAERLPLKAMCEERPDPSRPRTRFESCFIKASEGRVRASLFGTVSREDGQWVADHLWVRQTWDHLRPGDAVEFFATVVPYTRQDGTVSYTLSDVNGLIVLRQDEVPQQKRERQQSS
jgi:hypothetical protein